MKRLRVRIRKRDGKKISNLRKKKSIKNKYHIDESVLQIRTIFLRAICHKVK
jgi:hypothetical protein